VRIGQYDTQAHADLRGSQANECSALPLPAVSTLPAGSILHRLYNIRGNRQNTYIYRLSDSGE
jgi:hypothetical protein